MVRHDSLEPVLAQFSDPAMYSVEFIARVVGVNPSLVYRAATEEGELSYVRFGKRQGIRISGAEAKRWITSRWGVGAARQKYASRAKHTTPLNGDKVRVYRHKRKLSMSQLAQKAGVGKATIARLEREGPNAGMRIENARKVAKALGIKPKTLGVKEEAYG